MINQKDSINIHTTSFSTPVDTMVRIFSRLDRKCLVKFEEVSKDILVYTERIWEEWRRRDHLNFSWASIPENYPKCHKWSYLLNDAIVTCISNKQFINKSFNLKGDNHFFEFLIYSLSLRSDYMYLIERFPEFRYFFEILYTENRMNPINTEEIALIEKNLFTLSEEKKEGGDLALLALKAELKKENQDDLSEDEEEKLGCLGVGYLSAIEKKATFLANHWMERAKKSPDILDDHEYISEENLKKYNNLNFNICSNASDLNELIAIKAAEQNDYRPIVKLLSMQSGFFILRIIKANLKLPSSVWLEAARNNQRYHEVLKYQGYHENVILLFAKAFEGGIEDLHGELLDEIADRVLTIKNDEDNANFSYCDLEYFKEIYAEFWEKDATDKLLSIQKLINAQVTKRKEESLI